ncbi:proton pump-interactor 1-like [Quillaja saponaria]|uniref:Proton pump-interactor 1-like n=1 Tax=Quillaja saponaria TaxID=32244 RepID=A0AAD7L0N0_QUISA|nr:proton pump-interactor 1-like [Quillaja saponaria]
MAVEVAGFEMVQGPVDNVTEGDKSVLHEKENGKLDQEPGVSEPIKFGSHGDEPVKEGKDVSDANIPKDAVDEWPAPKQIHSFYFVRLRPYDDPKIKAKIDQADKEISKKNQARFQLSEALKAKRTERAGLISQIKALRGDNRQFQSIMDEKIKEIEPLQQALGKLRNSNNAGKGSRVCSSEEELNNLIRSLQYCIQHESIPLAEEKQLLREIKQLEGTREKVIANAAMRAKVQDSMGPREDIQDQVKLIGGDLDGVRKEKQTLRSKINKLDEAVKALDKEISSIRDDLTDVTQKRDKTYESIQQLRKQRDEGNTYFYQSRTLLNKARDLAAKKDVLALEELSLAEVDKFMSLWSSNKTFRDDYEKRILPSLDSRQLSRDGRIRNPDEKPLVVVGEPTPSEADILPKASTKQPKEGARVPPEDNLPVQKVQKEAKSKGKGLKSTVVNIDLAETEIFEIEKPNKETSKVPEIDPEKLKEMKREEEIAKAKQALERKKKLAEKAAAKAALRAQKEAEKKLKEREKKAKNKAAASAPVTNPEEPAQAALEATEAEKVNNNFEASVPAKEKVRKENSIRYRNLAKASDSVPKAILKRKRATNYWMWAASAALLALVFVALGYIFAL